MSQLTRRNFLKVLAGLPTLALLKPEVAEAEAVEPKEKGQSLYDSGEIRSLPTGEYTNLVKWNGLGDSWESVDGGKTWIQTSFRPTLEETPEEVLRRFRGQFQLYT